MTRSLWLQRNRVQARFILAHPSVFHHSTADIARRFLELHGEANA